jgi:hypothetical protein
MRFGRVSLWLSSVGLLTFPSTASADDSAHDKAVATFQEGRRYIEQGNCDAAVTKLRESIAFEPSVGARLSIADCTEKPDPLTAWRALKDAASLALLNHDERVATAEQRAAGLERRLAMIQFKLAPATYELAGFELRVDGEVVDRYLYKAGLFATAPGKHLVEATAPSKKFAEAAITSEGATTVVAVQLQTDACPPSSKAAVPAPVASTPPPSEPSDPGSTRRTLGLVVGSVGVVGLATGAVFGLLTLSKKSSIQDACGGNIGACQAPAGSVDADQEAAKTSATISTASLIVGGAALLGGATLFFTAPKARTGSVKVTPSVAKGGGGLALGGTW